MYRLSSIIGLLGLALSLYGQSPHGDDFKINCVACHSSASWEIQIDTFLFNHDTTAFPLTGHHLAVDCKECHQTLKFQEASTECISCHTDIHRTTVGSDCVRCHTSKNWIVDNITELHQDNGFPLLGVHAAATCTDCHTSETNLEFNRIGNDCISCHLEDFNQTTNPNHKDANFSTNCIECHSIDGTDWTSHEGSVNHDFFPLTQGHEIEDCAACHTGGSFEDTPTDCFACHETDFEASENPNHKAADFTTNCIECHTTDVGWMPAEFANHDALFPIYSGAHHGEWTQCTDCHNNQSNYAEFTCTNCHTNPETDDGHVGVSGYFYENTACLACHPTGDIDNAFDHDDTNFPLTGVHIQTECIACHADGYAGTPTECAACHTTDFTETVNPNHVELGLSNDCASCHTTEPDWIPASFDIHDDFYQLNGAHAAIAHDCAACHNGDYTNTQTDCFGCHADDYNQSTNPNHLDAQFPTDCKTCHDETAWAPSSFNHDDHWVLDGGHAVIADDCVACHNGDYTNTPTTCAGCHTEDHTQTINPSHTALNLSTDCASCHTTEPDWKPASFDIHDDFYPLVGAHANIADNCAMCHNGDYTNTPNDCFGCHADDYNNAIDPNHQVAQFSTDCTSCHSETEWVPSTFDHDGEHFPIYSGAHEGEWAECLDCHTNLTNYAEFTCTNCHTNPQTDDEHAGVTGYIYENTACLACHPTGDVDNVFDHDATNFPLTGAHITTSCLECHSAGYEGTPTDCAACHTMDFDQTTNPNHNSLGLSTDCASCHTTDPGWSPATFDNHDDYYALNGAHAAISNDCAACHNGDYNNTPTDCNGCHADDYNSATNPNHADALFPTDCASCHSEDAWTPSSFNHNDYWIIDGAHTAIENDCVACHNGDYANTPNTCAGCHTEDHTQSVNPSHTALNLSPDCTTCHTTEPDWQPASFDIHNDFYPLVGAHAAISNDCAACHNGDYNNTPTDCFGCHADDYNSTTDPHHQNLQFSTNCIECHTESEWLPSTFDHDGQYFPIYSGAHEGEWSDCIDCHTNLSNYAEVTCVTCHTNPETDDQHVSVNGYAYESTACLACHPTGDADNVFDHNTTNFPLTGAHITTSCLECHSAGYEGTPTDCAACHTMDFDQTTNPNHHSLGLSTDCASCHTTDAGWSPASFDNHDDYYALNGAHANISNDCAACHNGDYNNTPTDCAGCHTDDFNATTDPDHETALFPTDCASCHSEDAWTPSSFNHNDYWVIDGAHTAIENDCVACHNGDYSNTPNTCNGCHADDHAQSVNPSHTNLNLSTDCTTCHTTEPDWQPASFDIHDDFYPLVGAHADISNDCIACHNGDYNNTPTDCYGCHADDYLGTIDPNHQTLQFSTDCTGCHTESEWLPSTFDHDGQYFPIYSGAHDGEWSECLDCHTNPSNYAEFTCTNCHTNPETDDQHVSVTGYIYENTACLACHPTGDADNIFDHDATNFPLTGAHITTSCLECHSAGYEGTPTDCAACHTQDFNQTTNPNHINLGLSTDCESCHTTEPGWSPATFDIHDDFYVLNGAHANISNDCAACHNGDYNNTPNTCIGCHLDEFNATTDPDHETAQFPTDCIICHSEDDWTPSSFNHNDYWVIDGAHLAIENDCVACHNGSYSDTPNTCDGCHIEDYNESTNPNHANLGLSTDCESCHTTDPGWAPATFDIHDDYWVIDGAHTAVENDCAACHGGDYNNTPNDCNGCHAQDYTQSVNPSHTNLNLSTDCATCHTTEPDWKPAMFDIHDDFYPLNGAHANIANDCAACHNGDYNNTPNTCYGCHAEDYNNTTNPDHEAAQFPTDCATCHSEDAWSPSSFNHDDYWVLDGAHAAIATDCNACHNGNYNNTPNTCDGCHMDDFNNSTNPNHITLGLSTDCQSCHTTDPGWAPATFDDHDNYYVLDGAHAAISNDCVACHNGNYNNTPNTCDGCHIADYNNSTNPNHIALNLPTTCDDCHTTEPGWSPATFDIHDDYWVIDGAHTAVENDCVACHNGDYNNTPNTCDGCHMTDYNGSTNPNHVNLGIPTDCESCHTTDPGWSPATFDIHDQYWVIDGAHLDIENDCAACHNGNYNNTPNTCDGCHMADFNATTNPNHPSIGIPVNCDMCHTTDPGWVPATFPIHDDYWVIDGAHLAIADNCVDCHNDDYNNTPNTCDGCHIAEYNATTNPNHIQLNLPLECDMCHTTDPTWMPATFPIHDDFYPLNGAHALIANNCVDCHNGNYNNTPNTCDGCHIDDYNATTNPNHASAQFPVTCEDCHTEDAWIPSFFNHDDYYVLDGAHASIANDCNLCHIGGNYNNTPNTCDGCHMDDYNATTNPSHLTLGLSTDCESCHTTDPGWSPASFAIHDQYYVLDGAHAAVANDCILCHNGNYNNTPNTCDGCHIDDYNSSTNPNHLTLGLSTDCESCHTTDPGWSPASFAIHDQYYVLDGAHAAVANDCVLCHNGDYNNTPNTCDGCHIDDYNSSTNPNHVILAIPTTCDNCHTTDPGWSPATFDIHDDYWVIDGAHTAVADDCVLCHNGDYNNTPNTCDGCHMDDYNATTNPNHPGIAIPVDCDMCHTTDPGWIPATFPIHDDYWVIDGAHSAIADNCVDCHNGDYNNTPNTCDGCHMNDYNATTNPNHPQLGLPVDCDMCHTTDPNWTPATFPIHDDFYPLNGAHAIIANDCVLCHNGNYNNTPNTCDGCHMDDYNGATNPNHIAAQFPVTCQDCHTEDAWIPSTFDHNTFYPLTGGHAIIANDCVLCHVGGNYSNTPNTCDGCHIPDYNQTTNPNHNQLGLSTDCEMCHTTDPNWMPATFPIHNQFWPLNGAHANIANNCVDCHNGNYNNTPTDCFGCHADDYNGATNPNHASAGFPTTCQDCHTEDAWTPSTFDHDGMYFPIYSGNHKDEWDQCNECHTTPNNFTAFSCIDCHEHDDPAELADDHQGVNGYVYQSSACYACHPDGEE